jgi:hypothetical protein
MSARRSLRITAYHEAGHALAALVLGQTFTRVSIYNEPQPHRPGLLRRGELVPAPGKHRYPAVEVAITVLAGPIAQAKYSHRPLSYVLCTGGVDDMRRADRLMSRAGAYPLTVKKWARKIVTMGWPKIEAIAEALIERGTVDYVTALELCGVL